MDAPSSLVPVANPKGGRISRETTNEQMKSSDYLIMHTHVSGFVKIRKILSHKVGNTITMNVVVFWSTEINF